MHGFAPLPQDQIRNAEFMYPENPWKTISKVAVQCIQNLLVVKHDARKIFFLCKRKVLCDCYSNSLWTSQQQKKYIKKAH